MASSSQDGAGLSAAEPVAPARPREGFVGFLAWAAPVLATGLVPGLIAGVIAGGGGARVAMRILAMTSAPVTRGFQTDFGATVGEITTGGTVFLLILGGILGIAGGLFYLAVRPLLKGPVGVRGLVFGVLVLALVGPFLVDRGNPDFVILSPAGLAVAMFSALPILFGLLFVPLQRWLEPKIVGVRRPLTLLPAVVVGLTPLVLLGGVGLLVIAAALVVWMFGPSAGDREKRALRSVGYVVVGGLALWRGAVFVSGVMEIL